MEVQVGGLFFTSNFDSGNLGDVKKIVKEDGSDSSEGPNILSIRFNDFYPDYGFNVWTKPDCANTIYENGNRSWFHFGVRGASAGKLIKINIMNMNRQGRLYSEGYYPLVRCLPGKPKWRRIYERPLFETINGQFILSFIHRFTEPVGSTTYFAFAYPYSYRECQNQICEIENRFEYCKNISSTSARIKDTIYFYRELLCYSLEHLRVDLITISSFHGITDREEPRFDAKLFPEKDVPRCREFKDKRVFVLTSRVHPGETPASFVFSGFLKFILRKEDPRAIQLRKQFVFKLIPILNPDGVYNGHYRTDSRGVDLNRVYSDPSFELNPSIYAVKSMIIYYHVNYRLNKDSYSNVVFPPPDILNEAQKSSSKNKTKVSMTGACRKQLSSVSHLQHSPRSESPGTNYKSRIYDQYKPAKFCDKVPIRRKHSLDSYDTDYRKKGVSLHRSLQIIEPVTLTNEISESTDSEDSIVQKHIQNVLSQYADYTKEELVENVDSDLLSHLSTLTVADNAELDDGEYTTDFHPESSDSESEEDEAPRLGNEGSDGDQDIQPALDTDITYSPHLNNSAFREILPQHSGVAFYVDLHSHSSCKGCFIYGNFIEDDELQVQNMLYPKLISLNTAHFEFSACNFTQRNMYVKGKRNGLSKEGTGRVAIYKSTGIIHSYTLECNYNTGKIINPVAPANGDNGRASPLTVIGIPPKYTPSIFENVGRALAIAALDMTDTNPWSRVTFSKYKHLYGTKEWLKKYCLVPKGFIRPKIVKPPLRMPSASTRLTRVTDNCSSTGSGPVPDMTHLVSMLATKKELHPVREEKCSSRRLPSGPRKVNLLVADKAPANSSLHKKSSSRPSLIRSMSGSSDSHGLMTRHNSRSIDSTKFSNVARNQSFKQRNTHSPSDHSNKKKLSTDLIKQGGACAASSTSDINRKLPAELTTGELPRNTPPKKKVKFSLLKTKQAAMNFLKGNIGKNVLKDEHCHNVEVEKLPRKQKRTRHSLPSLTPLQVADSRSDLKLRGESYTQSNPVKISSKHTKKVRQSIDSQWSLTNESQKANNKSEEPSLQ